MTYRVLGLMSGSSLDGLDLAFCELTENGGKWSFELLATDCYPYSSEWTQKLKGSVNLSAMDYQLLHTEYGHYLGAQVLRFIEQYGLHYKVALVASHGHTSFHRPDRKMTAQLGDGAAIAAVTGLPVVSDLRALDIAFGGQGAPIVPMAEKWLFPDHACFLNIGGIANLSVHKEGSITAFDVCPANRVLNALAAASGKEYDEGGEMAAAGKIDTALLSELNALEYYDRPFPKSLANDFGTDTVYPMIQRYGLSQNDALRTTVAHITDQITRALKQNDGIEAGPKQKLLVTGGGAFNSFLVSQLTESLSPLGIEVTVPETAIVQYKEALAMAFLGVLRWRQEYTVLASVTGASRDSIGGAVWIGQEA